MDMNAPYDVNQSLQQVFGMMQSGRNPQQVMQMLIQQNPQIQQTLSTLKNMANGRSPKEFFLQLAKQRGVNEQNLAQMAQMFGNQ